MPRRILYAQYTNPGAYPPLEHSSRILAEAGWEVLFLGTGSLGAETLCFPPHPNIREKKLRFCPAGWRQKVHFLGYCLWVLGTILSWRPRWVYFSTFHDVPLAWLVGWLPGVRVIYHEHDSPPPPKDRIGLLIASFRQRLFAHALCIWPNRRRAELCAPGAPSVHIVWNCPARSEVAPPRTPPADGPPAPGEEQLAVFYHGSINGIRLPMTVIPALAALPEGVRLIIAGYETVGSAGYVDGMRQEAARLGVGHRLHYLGQIPLREDLLRACRTADVGLAIMPHGTADINEANMTGASNKPFDYLACGLALLVSERPDWQEMFVDSGFGRPCDPGNPVSIAQALQWFLKHPAETRAMGERGRQRILADWNYESRFQCVFEEMDRDCATTG